MAVTGAGVLGGRYVLREVLGTGGMATVWRARDEVLGRDVAVKVLSAQYAADPGFLARFGREARHAARLNHPRLVTVFDSGVDGQMPFIVMELVAGRTLRQVLDQAGMLAAGEAVRIAAAVCEALEVAHAAGLVHRDITPANIVRPMPKSRSSTSASPGPTAGPGSPGPRWCWAPRRTCPRSRHRAVRPARGPTCTPWAACCLRCLPARRPSPPIRLSGLPTGMSMMIPARRRRGARACPRGWTRSPRGCWPRTRPPGRLAPPLPGPGCSLPWPRTPPRAAATGRRSGA